MIEFLWTYNHTWGSHLQRAVLKEDVSHFAVKFGHIVMHQVWNGFDIEWFPSMSDRYIVRYALKPREEDAFRDIGIANKIARKYHKANYDKTGWLYFGLAALKSRMDGSPLPKNNRWQQDHEFICTSLAKTIFEVRPGWLSTRPTDFEIVTPGALYENMRRSQQFSDVSEVYLKGTKS